MVTLVLPSSQVTLTDDALDQCGEGLRAFRSSHPYGGASAPINYLPHELLVEVFKLQIDLDTPFQSLLLLILVCQLWRNIIKDTPSLWCRISGGEGLPSIQKALTMAKDAPLEIKYCQRTAKATPTAFLHRLEIESSRRSPRPSMSTSSLTSQRSSKRLLQQYLKIAT